MSQQSLRPKVAFQQVTSEYARNNAEQTLHKPVNLYYLARFFDEDIFKSLQNLYPDGKVYIWGAKLERIHQVEKMLPMNCLVLFRREDLIG